MGKRPTRVLFWDIDGTLLVTGRAGMIAWERAFAAVTAGQVFPSVRPDGLTDHQIAAWLLGHTTLDASTGPDVQASASGLVEGYERELGAALPLRQGRVLDNVLDVLNWAQAGPLRQWLVTGNTRRGASAKLRHYGLSAFFSDDDGSGGADTSLRGSFSTQVEPRAHIVRRALELARAALPDLDASEVLVIGDTPHDIEGAHAIGAPVLALSTNVHSAEELAVHRPWRVLPQLPQPEAFAMLVEEVDGFGRD